MEIGGGWQSLGILGRGIWRWCAAGREAFTSLSLRDSQGPGRRVAAGREKEGMGEKDEDRKKERKKKDDDREAVSRRD